MNEMFETNEFITSFVEIRNAVTCSDQARTNITGFYLDAINRAEKNIFNIKEFEKFYIKNQDKTPEEMAYKLLGIGPYETEYLKYF